MSEARALKALRRIEKLRAELEAEYEILDAETEKLRRLKFKSGKFLILVDNFKNKNTAFRTTCVRRFELKRK